MYTQSSPFGFANEGEDDAFCPFLLYVGVAPDSLAYKAAVAAAVAVKAVLARSGLPEVEVAFVEMANKRSTGGPKLLSLNPVLDDVPGFRQPFSAALGLPIAPRETPYYEGTGGLYLRLGSDPGDARVTLLTCAHVVRPPPAFPANTGMSYTNPSQPKEYVVALGSGSYDKANAQLAMIPPNHPRRAETTAEVDKATRRINALNDLHTEVTKYRATKALRTVGWSLHSSPIRVGVEPLGYTEDWGLIQLDLKQIDMDTFPGNKIFVGGRYTLGQFAEAMFPNLEDQATYAYPADSLLQAYGAVPAAKISNPPHLDVNVQRCMMVVKHGAATETRFGRANGLESVKRSYLGHGIVKHDSLEIVVLPYGKGHPKFSDSGDSGSIVVTREGEILGLLTGGAGPIDETDITWLTPFWWLQEQIKREFPGAFLYPVVGNRV
ncbi:hypothetical protein BOTBODRAFT_192282 [Botryobasidium botryosum FD-172 SS1]|uniref:Uncharacterized protein n=1 Tax=Botryobasidium botryosum (strain FD-172 SS1) TaxID=930990 RepID=A0A067M7T4_BOTB1|nr:hypothetical protein BOTBODRAFT_192282 [Botryobasidium botryosum FD-172 SS1]